MDSAINQAVKQHSQRSKMTKLMGETLAAPSIQEDKVPPKTVEIRINVERRFVDGKDAFYYCLKSSELFGYDQSLEYSSPEALSSEVSKAIKEAEKKVGRPVGGAEKPENPGEKKDVPRKEGAY